MSTTTNPNFKNRSTPGVYITELDAFPTSVVGVKTAVPAFIGYTEKATVAGKSVLMQPVAISSMTEFESIFGTEYNTLYEINPWPSSPPSGSGPDVTVDGQSFVVVEAANQPQFNLYYSMRLFYANGGSTCYVVSVGDYTSGPVAMQPLLDGLTKISYQVGPTMLVVPDAVLLPTGGPQPSSVPASTDYNAVTQAMLTQCETLQDRVAIFDIYGTTAVNQSNVRDTLDPCIAQFQQSVINTSPSYGMAYFPFLVTSIVQSADINYTNFDPAQPAEEVLSPLSPPHVTQLQYVLTLFNQAQYPDPKDPVTGKTTPNATQQKVQTYIDGLNSTDPDTNQSAPHNSPGVATINNTLSNALPAYKQLLALVAQQEGVLPPSGAMAGVFTLNDQNQGVWNAPANVSVANTSALTVNLSDQQQGDLNVPVNGKAVDVIRYFSGRGPVVWGARTLDGNSQDWRYIQVRRTIVYIEQSIKDAINPFVFAANDSKTWVAVVQMISGFLQGLWSQGGLMGDKASDAFSVLCGMPQTMTATDILNGYMVVQVNLCMIHPAEFIELTFKQTMQGA